MKIATLGSGHIGGTLGKTWALKGHQVFFSSRDPHGDKMKALLKEAGSNAQAGSVEEAIAFGDVVLLAIGGKIVEDVLGGIGNKLSGKILIDVTNRFDGKSGYEVASHIAPGAKVVKAFNSLAAESLSNPVYNGERASMFYAGIDAEAKKVVAKLIEDIGFEPIDLGGVEAMPSLENYVAGIWGCLSRQYGRQVAVRVLKR